MMPPSFTLAAPLCLIGLDRSRAIHSSKMRPLHTACRLINKRSAPHAGFEDLHSFAFIGNSGRIGTASDGLFSYVPAGPNKQIDMFLRAYDLRKEGRLEVPTFMPAQAVSAAPKPQNSLRTERCAFD